MGSDHLKNIEKTRNTDQQLSFYDQLNGFLQNLELSDLDKSRSFPVYATRQAITTFIERFSVYNLIREVPGSILECGVGSGFGLMSFMHFCSIFEPYHYIRKVYGFDTFEGFAGITEKDQTSQAAHLVDGGLNFGGYERIKKAVEIHDMNRALGHIPKVELVKGDISKSLPGFLEKHPELVVGLLYLDMDLYQPTRDTLNLLIDRIPRGGVICFDELNHGDYPGETLAVMETLGLRNIRLRRFEFSSMLSYAVVGE